MFIKRTIVSIATVCLFLMAVGTVQASPVFEEDFNAYLPGSGLGSPGVQADTSLVLGAYGTLSGWTATGTNVIHAVDLDPTAGKNWAAMIFDDNVLLTSPSISTANTFGTLYDVSFLAGPTVYQASSQATTAADGLVFEILLGDNSVLEDFTVTPGAWSGSQTLNPASFVYTGDGSGDVRIRISSLTPDGTFGGAVDNLEINVVPEPATMLLLGSGLIGLAGFRRRFRKK
ncbi:PEP-CTERM sorting domain-containing protein [Thermodesulfobacteriota bacterium]